MKIFDEKNIIHFPILNSTNDMAVKLLKKEKVKKPFIVSTDFQTAGRGQKEKKWESESGKNLILSIIVFPKFLSVHNQFILSKIVSLGIVEALSDEIKDMSIKWPNDIYVKDKKLGGILIESAVQNSVFQYVVCGIGINVNQTEFANILPNPVSLKLITGKNYSLKLLLSKLINSFETYYNMLKTPENDSIINKKYLEKLYRFDKFSMFTMGDKQFKGKIVSIDESGQLGIYKHNGKVQYFNFGDIEFANI